MKEKIIYTRWLANALVKAGFPVVRVEENPNKPNFDCWVFAETPDFKLAYVNISNKG
jgi:hypothetical protein